MWPSSMAQISPDRPRVFVDADVLFAGAAGATRYGASLVILTLAEVTLIEAVASQQVVTEAKRNLAEKLPAALPAFRLLVARCLRVVPDPELSALRAFAGLAHPKDTPILAAAVLNGCPWLVTFNVRHYTPGHPGVRVMQPGQFVNAVRGRLAGL